MTAGIGSGITIPFYIRGCDWSSARHSTTYLTATRRANVSSTPYGSLSVATAGVARSFTVSLNTSGRA
jgi:hypothetical protein